MTNTIKTLFSNVLFSFTILNHSVYSLYHLFIQSNLFVLTQCAILVVLDNDSTQNTNTNAPVNEQPREVVVTRLVMSELIFSTSNSPIEPHSHKFFWGFLRSKSQWCRFWVPSRFCCCTTQTKTQLLDLIVPWHQLHTSGSFPTLLTYSRQFIAAYNDSTSPEYQALAEEVKQAVRKP